MVKALDKTSWTLGQSNKSMASYISIILGDIISEVRIAWSTEHIYCVFTWLATVEIAQPSEHAIHPYHICTNYAYRHLDEVNAVWNI